MSEATGVRPETHRIFIAVPIPEPVKDALERVQAELRRALAPRSVRWSRRDQLHVTLRFLGNVESQQVDELIRSVRHACEAFGVLQLRAFRIGMFPSPNRPRVLWTGVADQGHRLAALQRRVEEASAAFTHEKPEPAFVGHVTLGRCKAITRRDASTLGALAVSMERRSFGDWAADRVEIIRSELGAGGSRHTTLAAAIL
jgi:2'-5' RNA ligase